MKVMSAKDMNYLSRTLVVWLLIMWAESINGLLRIMLLTPVVGDFHARQIGALSGSLLILAIACLSVRWIHAEGARALLTVGLVWLALTAAFELIVGRYIFHLPWERLASDYRIEIGGLMPFGLVVMALSPLVADRIRGRKARGSCRRLAGARRARRVSREHDRDRRAAPMP